MLFAGVFRSSPPSSDLTYLLLSVLIGVLAVLLLIGCLNPLISTLAALVHVAASLRESPNWVCSFLTVSVLLAMAALGPGAYSVDAWIFGRKKVTIVRRPQ